MASQSPTVSSSDKISEEKTSTTLIEEENLSSSQSSLIHSESVESSSTMSTTPLLNLSEATIDGKKKRHKQDQSLSAWMCRMWFGLGLLLVWPIAWLLTLPIYLGHKYFGLDKKKTLLGKIFRGATAMVVKSNPYWKLKTKFTDKSKLPKSEKKMVFVCNHQSNMDPFVLISGPLPIETKWVSKSDLFSVPFAGRMMKQAGDVPIAFKSKKMDDMSTDRDSVKTSMNKLKEHLKNDAAVFFFPEGRRNDTPDELKDWKKGAFIMALETGADIVPIGLYGTFSMWPIHDALPKPGKACIVVGTPISVAGMTLEKDVDTLTEQTKVAVNDLMLQAREEYFKM
ncbi:hypothetical protein FDP41_011366 [Naegleria fowleri]|uniref:Phospholipid/glycerol acyltransferase domain-containing protein n=1 Tax=Naegleria fowleri TaxID=5763 RepID=A0A6A5C3W1_NAEFO|nr:uncharacterized protein FDP41_011366 [Naegleria fowleri]KAF0982436.1 hypothetical protein FDP41_011366 [Naegleria fowleri]